MKTTPLRRTNHRRAVYHRLMPLHAHFGAPVSSLPRRMQDTSVYDRALLAEVLQKVLSIMPAEKLQKSYSLRNVRGEMIKTLEVLEEDKEVHETTVKRIHTLEAKIMSLCSVLQILKVEGVNKTLICQQMRSYLSSGEECACSSAKRAINDAKQTDLNDNPYTMAPS